MLRAGMESAARWWRSVAVGENKSRECRRNAGIRQASIWVEEANSQDRPRARIVGLMAVANLDDSSWHPMSACAAFAAVQEREVAIVAASVYARPAWRRGTAACVWERG